MTSLMANLRRTCANPVQPSPDTPMANSIRHRPATMARSGHLTSARPEIGGLGSVDSAAQQSLTSHFMGFE